MQISQDTTKIESNVEVTRQQFGIKDMSLVMTILTKMYSNPVQTLTQEYISNARDANREVRQTRKLEITAPTRFCPNMIIRDFGPGLSPERINEVFLYYGSSTKRTTNTQTGGFGIGGKSAWAYTDSFTITSWHDGYKRTYIAHKSNGNGNLDLISEAKSSEPNGTAIEIAVNPIDAYRFKNAILRTIFFWKDSERPILKAFEPSELSQLDLKPESDNFKEIKIYKKLPEFVTNNKSMAIIDGIPYPIHWNMTQLDRLIRQSYAVFLNTGDVNIAPNREEFVDDKVSQAFFDKLTDLVYNKIKGYIDEELKRVPNLKDGLKQFIALYQRFDFKGKYKDYNIDGNGIWISDPAKANTYRNELVLGTTYESGYHKIKKHDITRISMNSLANIYYDDMPNEAATKKMWRIRKILDSSNRYFYLLNNTQKDFATELDTKLLSSIDASDYTVNRQAKAAIQKQEICIQFFDGRLNPSQKNIADVTDTIVYALLSDLDVYDKRTTGETEKLINYINNSKGMKFAFIAESHVDKIKTNKHFIELTEFIKTHKPSDDSIKGYCNRLINNKYTYYQYLLPIIGDIKDQTLKYIIDLTSYPFKSGIPTMLPKCFVDEDHALIKLHNKYIVLAEQFKIKYPMLASLLCSENMKTIEYKNDLIVYLNRKHRESTKVV